MSFQKMARPKSAAAEAAPAGEQAEARGGRGGAELPAGYLQHYGIVMRRESAEGAQPAPSSDGCEGAPGAEAAASIAEGGGAPLEPEVKREMEEKFSADFSAVRVHTDAQADAACKAINAEAFTRGSHLYFRAGKYNPASAPGKELLAHELTHVVQQAGGRQPSATEQAGGGNAGHGGAGGGSSGGANGPVQASALVSQVTDAVEVEARALGARVAAGERVSVQGAATSAIHRANQPSYCHPHTFLGCTTDSGRGVNPDMAAALDRAEENLRAQFAALSPAEQVKPDGTPATTHVEWLGGLLSIRGWRDTTSKHGTGSAVDINYRQHPYIATRTGSTIGGERTENDTINQERGHAVEVYDRAVRFMHLPSESADVSIRTGNTGADVPTADMESTGSVYDRFRRTSDSLRDYLQFAFPGGPAMVERRPVDDIEGATEAQLLEAIPETERRPRADAIARLQVFMTDPQNLAAHPEWASTTVEQVYLRILRDYEWVRIPMVSGDPARRPGTTRNPANGFLSLRREVVCALCDQGRLRWGAADFGPSRSGDVHHFDLGYQYSP